MTKKEILQKLVLLERKYRLLSGDLIYQDDLFAVQEELCEMMAKIANDTQTDLAKHLPYLFKSEQS